jgi:hypothetical protein
VVWLIVMLLVVVWLVVMLLFVMLLVVVYLIVMLLVVLWLVMLLVVVWLAVMLLVVIWVVNGRCAAGRCAAGSVPDPDRHGSALWETSWIWIRIQGVKRAYDRISERDELENEHDHFVVV